MPSNNNKIYDASVSTADFIGAKANKNLISIYSALHIYAIEL